MAAQIVQYTLPGAKIVRNYAERLLAGIEADQFSRKPLVGGEVVNTNHPAFIYGHLSLYPARLAPFLGLDSSSVQLPENYSKIFSDGSPCIDDAEGTVYPPMQEITSIYLRHTDWLLDALPSVPEQKFSEEMPDPKRRERFPTIGAFMTYLMLAHPNGHLGQVSTWRRCMGLPAA